MSDFEDELDRQAEQSDENALAVLQRKLEEATRLKDLLDEQEALAKATKSSLHHVRTQELPDLMLELRMDEVTVNGWQCKLDDLVEGSFPKDEVGQVRATKHLEELGGSDILRTTITLSFPKAQHDEAVKALGKITALGYAPELNTTVHFMTYQSFVRELIAQKRAFSEKLLGVLVGKIVKFKKVAKK